MCNDYVMTKLVTAFRSFANAPRNGEVLTECDYRILQDTDNASPQLPLLLLLLTQTIYCILPSLPAPWINT